MSRASILGLATLALGAGLAGCEPDFQPPVVPPPPPPPAVTAEPPPAAPADPAPVVDGDVTVAYENGLRILVKRIPGAELTATHLYIKGGVRNWTKADAGVEMMALRTAVDGGAGALDKDAFTKKLSALGSDLGASSGNDYASLSAKSLTTEFDATFGLLADAFLAPQLPPSEIEVQRQRQLTAIRRDEENPDAKLGLLALKAMFAGHPYENRPVGTIESVTALNAEALKGYLAKVRETSRLELVVVGDVPADHVRELAQKAFGKLPRGAYAPAPLPPVRFDKAKVTIAEQKLPTNYIQAGFVGPTWKEPEFAPGIVAMTILGDRVWEEVRTKRNLSYAPSAGFRWGGEVPRGVLYVTAVDPATTWKVMLDEAKKLATETVSEKDLAGAKSQFLTHNVQENEATDGQAGWLAMCDLVGGDWQLARKLPALIKTVTAADVKTFGGRFVGHLQTVVVGDPTKIDKSLFESL